MIHVDFPSLSLSLCVPSTIEQKKTGIAGSSRLFLGQQGRSSLVFDLLVECVAVADGGDVVAFVCETIFDRSNARARVPQFYVPYHQP